MMWIVNLIITSNNLKKMKRPYLTRLFFSMAVVGCLSCFGSRADVHYIAVASDRHGTGAYMETSSPIYKSLQGMPSAVEYVCMAGDMVPQQGSGQGNRVKAASTTNYKTSIILSEIQQVFPSLTNSDVSIIYADHDAGYTDDAGIMRCLDSDGLDNDGSGDSELVFTGKTAAGNAAYYVYGVSFASMINGTDDGPTKFEAWVDGITDTSVPIIVVSHVPLHYAKNSKGEGADNKGAEAWSKALNYAATGSETTGSGATLKRNVIFLHGHYHGIESDMDNGTYPYEYFIPVGSTMKVYNGSSTPSHHIYYTYTTAGYMAMNSTATLIAIGSRDITLTKYKGGTTPASPYASAAYNSSSSLSLGTYVTDSPNTVARIFPNVTLYAKDNGSTGNLTSISASNGKTCDVTLSGHTLYKDNCWNTLCLPFDVDLTDTDSPLYGATVMKLASSSFASGTLDLNFESVTGTLTAGTPYIVKWSGGSSVENPTFHGVTFASTAAGTTTTDYVNFAGCYEPVTLTANDRAKLYLGSSNTLYYPASNIKLSSFHAYFELQQGLQADDGPASDVRAFNIHLDGGESTGIVELMPEPLIQTGWYTIDGRRLPERPATSGLYIRDGRKVMVK